MVIALELNLGSSWGVPGEAVGHSFGRRLLNGVVSYANSRSDVKLHVLDSVFSGAEEPGRFDGVIGRGGMSGARRQLSIGPAVNVASRSTAGVPQVCCDNGAIARMAFEHFRRSNLHHFAFVHVSETMLSTQRRDEFCRVCGAEGFTAHVIELERDGDPAAQEKALEDQLKALPKPAGILLTKDTLATRVFAACDKLGICVPDDVAILGIDNFVDVCLSTTPRLSSIDINTEQIGFLAAKTMCDVIDGKEVPACQYVPPIELVMRGSTTAVPRLSPGISAVVAFMRENLSQPITMEDLLWEQGLSRRTLERAFHVELGQSPMHYLRELRLNKAAGLLVTTDLNVSTIGRQCGFRRPNHLCSQFKTRYGMTPLQYRRAALAKRGEALRQAQDRE